MTSQFTQRYGPWAVVAGASDGTGAAFAEQLAARGLNVVLVARRRFLLDELADRLPTEARVVAMDLSTPTAGDELLAATADLDIGFLAYNAAGIGGDAPLRRVTLTTPADRWCA